MTEITAYQSEDGKVYASKREAINADFEQKEKIARSAIKKLLADTYIGNSEGIAKTLVEKKEEFIKVLSEIGQAPNA